MVLAFPQSGRLETLERMTADEFFLYAPEDQPCELIDGVLRMSPPPWIPMNGKIFLCCVC